MFAPSEPIGDAASDAGGEGRADEAPAHGAVGRLNVFKGGGEHPWVGQVEAPRSSLPRAPGPLC